MTQHHHYPKLFFKYTWCNLAYLPAAPILPHPGTQPVVQTLQGVIYGCRHGDMISRDGRGSVGLAFNRTGIYFPLFTQTVWRFTSEAENHDDVIIKRW